MTAVFKDIQPAAKHFMRSMSRPAIVTPLGGLPVVTRIIEGSIPSARQLRIGIIEDPRPRCSVPRRNVSIGGHTLVGVPSLRDGSQIAAYLAGKTATWRVEAIEKYDDDFYHVIVAEEPA